MRKGENLRTLSAKEAADIAALSPGVTRGPRGEVVTVFKGPNATALFEAKAQRLAEAVLDEAPEVGEEASEA